MLVQLRSSNEALPRARVLGAQEQRGSAATPIASHILKGVADGPSLRALRDHRIAVGPQ